MPFLSSYIAEREKRERASFTHGHQERKRRHYSNLKRLKRIESRVEESDSTESPHFSLNFLSFEGYLTKVEGLGIDAVVSFRIALADGTVPFMIIISIVIIILIIIIYH